MFSPARTAHPVLHKSILFLYLSTQQKNMDQLCVSMYASMHSHCCACMFGPKQVHTYCTYIHTYIHYLLTIMAILLSSVADKNCLLHKSLLHNTRMLLIVLLSTNYIQNTVTSIHTYIHTYIIHIGGVDTEHQNEHR